MVKWSGFTKTPGSWATWNSSDRMASPGWYGGPTTCGSKACLWGSVDFQAWNASYKLHTHLAKQMSFQCKKIYILEIKSEFHPKTTCCCNDSARFRFWLGSCQGRSFMHSFDSTWFASLLPVYLFFFLSSIGLTFINAWTCCIYIYREAFCSNHCPKEAQNRKLETLPCWNYSIAMDVVVSGKICGIMKSARSIICESAASLNLVKL